MKLIDGPLGTFVTVKQQPSSSLAFIHSKPVIYNNNGGGRDTYISQNSGGLRVMNQPAYSKRTFYTGLREYPEVGAYHRSATKSNERGQVDVFSRSQNHWNRGFQKEQNLVKNYQQ